MGVYNNSNVRRQDRLLEEEAALNLLRDGEFGVLSMVENRGDSSGAYSIPINYAWDGDHSIYFHCAPEGAKLEALDKNPHVSFCVVGQTEVISHQFTTAYESIIIRGKIYSDLSESERMNALELLLDKYSPRDKEVGMKYAKKSLHRTAILRLDIETASGKTKRKITTIQ